MRRDSRLSNVLHVVLHMADHDEPLTSERLAQIMTTNPVVVRRVMAGLRDAGLVQSAKGHGGGWTIACDLTKTTLYDVYSAVGAPEMLALGPREEAPGCLVEQAVNAAVGGALAEAEALILARFREITLADLARDFSDRHRQHKAGKRKAETCTTTSS